MPLYEYTCGDCKTPFEKLVRSMSNSDEKAACPKCGSSKTARTLSVFAVSADTRATASNAPAAGMCGCGRIPGTCGGG